MFLSVKRGASSPQLLNDTSTHSRQLLGGAFEADLLPSSFRRRRRRHLSSPDARGISAQSYDYDPPQLPLSRRLGVGSGSHYSPPSLLTLAPSIPRSPLGVDSGTHYAHIYVGTPPQRQSVILDTGSHFAAFPCVGCASCGAHTDPPFDSSKSSTSRPLPCSACEGGVGRRPRCEDGRCVFEQSYAEGSSWEAVQLEDVLWVGGPSLSESDDLQLGGAVPLVFGCQRSETGLFPLQLADGILGLAMHDFGLMRHLVALNLAPANMFSLCFTDTGGTFAIGGMDLRRHEEVLQFTPLASPSGWFEVRIAAVYLGDKLVSDDPAPFRAGHGSIVDSGTTDTYLPSAVGPSFRAAWLEAVGEEYRHEARACSALCLAGLPTLWLVFDNGARWAVAPGAYMEVEEGGAPGRRTPRIYLDEIQGAVIGANAMLNKDVLFDEQNQRIGFAKSSCEL